MEYIRALCRVLAVRSALCRYPSPRLVYKRISLCSPRSLG